MKKFHVQWREYHTIEIEAEDEVEAIRSVRLSLGHRISANKFEAFELETETEQRR